MLETRDGNYWISTNEGIYRANPNQINDVRIDNIVKHSEATIAEVSLRFFGDHRLLVISDNGRGFDREKFLHDKYIPGMGGNGLHKIERSRRDLGGRCTIISSPGARHWHSARAAAGIR